MMKLGLSLLAAVVVLPPFTVTDSRVLPKPESWRYAAPGGFEVLTSAPNEESTKLVHDFLVFHRGIETVWPLVRMNAAVPASLILCGKAKQITPFVPADQRSVARGFLSLSFQDREIAAIVINLDPAEQDDSGAPGKLSQYSQDVLRKEYVHFILARIGDRVPAWLETGLWQTFTTMVCSGDQLGFPAFAATDPDLKARQTGDPKALAAALQAGTFLPLDRVFAPRANATGDETDAWGREAREFVHLCLLGDPEHYRAPFLDYALRTARFGTSEDIFRHCFKTDYAGFLPVLWKYTGFSQDKGFKLTGPGGGKTAALPKVTLKPAEDGQVGRIKGEALRMAHHDEDAHWALIAPYLRGSRDPELLASLGLAEAAEGKADRARTFLEAATAGNTHRARAWEELGRLRLQAAEAAPQAPESRLSTNQLASVLEPLFHARQLPPALPEVYATIADAWARAGIRPAPGHLKAVDEGVMLFPYDTDLVCRDAELRVEYQYPADAAALCKWGMTFAERPEDRARLQAIVARLPRDSTGVAGGKP